MQKKFYFVVLQLVLPWLSCLKILERPFRGGAKETGGERLGGGGGLWQKGRGERGGRGRVAKGGLLGKGRNIIGFNLFVNKILKIFRNFLSLKLF